MNALMQCIPPADDLESLLLAFVACTIGCFAALVVAGFAARLRLIRARGVWFSAVLCAGSAVWFIVEAVSMSTSVAPGSACRGNAGLIAWLAAAVSGAVIAAVLCLRRLYLSAGAVEQRRLIELADPAGAGVLMCEGERIVALNSFMERLLSGGRGAARGRPLAALFPGWTVERVPSDAEVEASLQPGGPESEIVPVCLLKRQIAVGRRVQTMIAVRDRRDSLRLEAELNTPADGDRLTGLGNRTRFHAELAEPCAHRAATSAGGRMDARRRCASAAARLQGGQSCRLACPAQLPDAFSRARHPMPASAA